MDDPRVTELQQRVALLEQQVEWLYNNSVTQEQPQGYQRQAPDSTVVTPEEIHLARNGKIIHAVKSYRSRTGVSLKAAKDTVEAAAR